MGFGGNCNMYMGYLWPFGVQGHFGVIQCTCVKMACSSKKLSETDWNLGLRGTCNIYMGYLWPFSVQSHLGVKMPVSRKCLALGENETSANRSSRASRPMGLLLLSILLLHELWLHRWSWWKLVTIYRKHTLYQWFAVYHYFIQCNFLITNI